MIHITFSPEQTALADRIRDDLTGVSCNAPLLIALVSQASNADPAVQAEIENARDRGIKLLPILTDDATLPQRLAHERPLNFAGGYQRERLLQRLDKLSMTSADVRRANRRALVFIAALAIVMFGLAIVGMAAGLVAFPVAEYNEEATFQAQWIDGLIRETLEAAMPRTTADAIGFAGTLEAAPTRLYYYIRGTATALPASLGS